MKKTIYLLALFITILFSCEKEIINSNNEVSEVETEELNIEYSYKSELKRDFAIALTSAINDHVELRQFIKDEALKMFDKDYDILYLLVKDEQIVGGKSFKDILLDNFEDEGKLAEIESNLPLLTILVPKLPENSFSASIWDIQNDIPDVAIRLETTNHVPIFKSDNTEYILEGGRIPAFPVIVVKENERLVVNNSSNKSNKNIKGSTLKSPDSNYEFKFLDDTFNNSKIQANLSQREAVTSTLDQKVIDAYNIYKNVDGWHRDYIYYNLTPTNIKDEFQPDFQEHITEFSLLGDPGTVYNKISDQTSDPEIEGGKNSSNASSWTGGSFEFKVNVLLNAQNGLGTEYITYFSAHPDELFDLKYKKVLPWLYILDDISLNSIPMSVNLGIFNWDLNQYSSSIKIDIEEVDLSVTTVITEARSVKFANNFAIDDEDGIFKKIGLKFGSSLETTTTQTIQKTFTQGNDELGSVIINFADDIIISQSGTKSTIRDYSTGWFKLNLEPLKVQ